MKFLVLVAMLMCLMQVIQVQAFFGLGGALLLKSAAAGFVLGRLSRGRGRRHHGRGYGRSYGRGYGHGYGHGYGRRHHYGRRRRDLDQDQDLELNPALEMQLEREEMAVEESQLDSYFSAIMAGDEDRCGLRLVCELHTMEPSRLGAQGALIMALFGEDVPRSYSANSPKLPYDQAANLGRTGSVEACAATYNTCQYDAEYLLEAMRTTPQQ